jgi:hypothetical protein
MNEGRWIDVRTDLPPHCVFILCIVSHLLSNTAVPIFMEHNTFGKRNTLKRCVSGVLTRTTTDKSVIRNFQ